MCFVLAPDRRSCSASSTRFAFSSPDCCCWSFWFLDLLFHFAAGSHSARPLFPSQIFVFPDHFTTARSSCFSAHHFLSDPAHGFRSREVCQPDPALKSSPALVRAVTELGRRSGQ
jgi:hypothetical protein